MIVMHSIDIHSKPKEVFRWLKDPENARAWMSSVSQTELLHQTSDMIGTTFRETVEEDGQSTELHGVITAYEPGRLIAFHLDGRFNTVDVAYRLQEVGDGTRLTQHADIRFKSFTKVLSLFFGAKFRKKIMDQLQDEFVKLKELCEQDAAA